MFAATEGQGRQGSGSLLGSSSFTSISASTMKGHSLERQGHLPPDEEPSANQRQPWVSVLCPRGAEPSPQEP